MDFVYNEKEYDIVGNFCWLEESIKALLNCAPVALDFLALETLALDTLTIDILALNALALNTLLDVMQRVRLLKAE